VFVPLTPLRCLHRAVDLYGSRIGVISGGREFTFAEFGARCERLATGLPKFGITAGDRVAYLSFNNHQLLEGYFGVIQARAILMPLNVRLSEPELAAILRHSGAKIAIFEDDFADIAGRLGRTCPNVKHWVAHDEVIDRGCAERADIFSYDEMAIAELFYTSGSTGAPKGVTLSHRTLYLHALGVASEYRDPETMVDLLAIPLFHANGWGHPQASTMLGIKQVMVRRFEPAQVFRLIHEHRATYVGLVPTMANALVNAPDRAEWDLSSLRVINIGGAASSPELVERVERAFPGCQCTAGYGLTETSPMITMVQPLDAVWLGERERRERLAMTGRAVVGASVRVVDANLHDVPRDLKTMGEVIVMGDQVMDGYFGDPDATSAAMSGPWLHTGDMAVWDEDGYIQIVDRKKQIIISGGENISSLEVEAAIFAHPAVMECAVVAAPDPKWGEVPAAIVVLKGGATLTREDLLGFLQQRLGRFKLPRIIEFSSDPLPKTGTGKIRKNELRERFWASNAKRVQG
jgi:acyl-CoA synthetase (AMP-forming)/AMP-acid ligase II